MIHFCRFVVKNVNVTQRRQMSLKSIAYKMSGFNKYGLMRDDLLNDFFDPDVAEALRRCEECKVDERNYRILRAMQLSLNHNILPKSEWMTLECDELYLTPLVEEIRRENRERWVWEKTH